MCWVDLVGSSDFCCTKFYVEVNKFSKRAPLDAHISLLIRAYKTKAACVRGSLACLAPSRIVSLSIGSCDGGVSGEVRECVDDIAERTQQLMEVEHLVCYLTWLRRIMELWYGAVLREQVETHVQGGQGWGGISNISKGE